MLNKSFAFGLLAAGLMVAPGAAFAQQDANNTQILNQQVGIDGSNNNAHVSGSQLSIQQQNQLGVCKPDLQKADNFQGIQQSAFITGKKNQANLQANQQSLQSQIQASRNYQCK